MGQSGTTTTRHTRVRAESTGVRAMPDLFDMWRQEHPDADLQDIPGDLVMICWDYAFPGGRRQFSLRFHQEVIDRVKALRDTEVTGAFRPTWQRHRQADSIRT